MEYQKYIPLIKKKVWQFHRSYGVEVDELEGVANLCFVEAVSDYDPEKATQFCTWLYHKIHYVLLEFALAKRVPTISLTEVDTEGHAVIDLDHSFGTPAIQERTCILKDKLSNLSEKGRYVAVLALNPTPELMENSCRGDDTVWSKKVTKHLLTKYLTKVHNWTYSEANRACSEISAVLKDI